jgi:fructuronate reductase
VSAPPTLSRAAGDGRAAAPVRLVHLGLGNFFRAHQAAYTAAAADAAQWGIAAFTGRSADLAQQLQAQDGLYTLITRADSGDHFEVIDSLVHAHAADEHDAWLGYLAAPATAALTLTVTEAAYLRGADGALDHASPDLRADLKALRADIAAPVRSVPARVVAGLAARHRAGAGPIAVIPCDNLPGNGDTARRLIGELASLLDPDLADWIDATVSFVSTVADRITPRAVAEDRQAVLAATGRRDACPVVTEPYHEWVLAGAFPAGRPDWPGAGARIVSDAEPFERRKLWLLNGAHSLLAYAGSIRGHRTVAEAIADATCRSWVEQWWDEAAPYLRLPAADTDRYRAALATRFANRAIAHPLAQVAADGSQKLPVRILPVLRQERARGVVPLGASRILAAWVAHLRGRGAPITDADAERIAALARGPLPDAVARLLGYLGTGLGEDASLVAAVLSQAEEFLRA